MGSSAQKKKLFTAMSEANARRKMLEVFKVKIPRLKLRKHSQEFTRSYGISLWALFEMWHSLRSRTKALNDIAEAFAESCARKNVKIHQLETTINLQRKELAKAHQCIVSLQKAEAERIKGGL